MGLFGNIFSSPSKRQEQLIKAVSNNDIQKAERLIEKGVDINSVDHNGDTFLKLAISKGYIEIVELLIEKGAALNLADKNADSVLRIAVEKGHTEIVRALVEKGADLNLEDNNGATLLKLALKKDYTAIAETLLEKGADLYLVEKDGDILLKLAVGKGYKKIAQLLKKELKYRVPDLHASIIEGKRELAKLLIEKNTDLNLKDHKGNTPLILALKKGYTEIAHLLIKKGTDDDYTSWALAKNKGYLGLVKLFEEQRAIRHAAYLQKNRKCNHVWRTVNDPYSYYECIYCGASGGMA